MEAFREEASLNKTCGQLYTYVGMSIDYFKVQHWDKGQMHYVWLHRGVHPRTSQNFPGSHSGASAVDHLFKVNKEASKLSQESLKFYHYYVAKLLYMAKQSRLDIKTIISFLCTWRVAPDKHNWGWGKARDGLHSEVPYRDTIHTSNFGMVSLWGHFLLVQQLCNFHHSQEYADSPWWSDDIRNQSNITPRSKQKAQHKKLNRSKRGWCWWQYAVHYIGFIFPVDAEMMYDR